MPTTQSKSKRRRKKLINAWGTEFDIYKHKRGVWTFKTAIASRDFRIDNLYDEWDSAMNFRSSQLDTFPINTRLWLFQARSYHGYYFSPLPIIITPMPNLALDEIKVVTGSAKISVYFVCMNCSHCAEQSLDIEPQGFKRLFQHYLVTGDHTPMNLAYSEFLEHGHCEGCRP